MGMGLSGTGLRGPWPTHVGKPKWAQQPHGHLNPQHLPDVRGAAHGHPAHPTVLPAAPGAAAEPSCSQAAGGI